MRGSTDLQLPQLFSHRRHDPKVDWLAYSFFKDAGRANDEFSRLISSIFSASLSLQAGSQEARLITIWSAFEALFPPPSKDKEGAVRITHFVEMIALLATFDHVKASFEALYRKTRENFGCEFVDIIANQGVGETKAEKLASLILGSIPSKDAFMSWSHLAP